MPEAETETIPTGTSTEDGSAPATDNAEETIFDNMTPEELKAALVEKDKGYNELRTLKDKQISELGELRKFREQAESDGKLASVLEAATKLAADKEKKPELDYEAIEAEIADMMQETPAEAAKKMMRLQSAWSAQDRKAIEDKYEKELTDLRSVVTSLKDAYETTTDDYKENKELIEKFREKGMSVADAKAMAKEVRDMMPASERTQPPPGVNPTRTVTPPAKKEPSWTEDNVAEWKAMGLSDDSIEKMKWKADRDANLTEDDRGNF
jgi:hypothetical protein